MAGALDGLVVLDLTTHLSGPFCGMQLGDLGADVIKIESPQGDSMRGAPPFIAGEGAPFMLWNRNKRGIRLDLKDAHDSCCSGIWSTGPTWCWRTSGRA